MTLGRRLVSVGWPVISAWALTSNTKSGGVRSRHSSDIARHGQRVVSSVDLDQRELRGVVVQAFLGRVGAASGRRRAPAVIVGSVHDAVPIRTVAPPPGSSIGSAAASRTSAARAPATSEPGSCALVAWAVEDSLAALRADRSVTRLSQRWPSCGRCGQARRHAQTGTIVPPVWEGPAVPERASAADDATAIITAATDSFIQAGVADQAPGRERETVLHVHTR